MPDTQVSPPPGFELDSTDASQVQPPPGFELDSQADQSSSAPPPRLQIPSLPTPSYQRPAPKPFPSFAETAFATPPSIEDQARAARASSPQAAASKAAGMPLAPAAGAPTEPSDGYYTNLRTGIRAKMSAVPESDNTTLDYPILAAEHGIGGASEVAAAESKAQPEPGTFYVNPRTGIRTQVKTLPPEALRQEMAGETELLQAAGEASTPLVAASGVAAPLKTALGFGTGYVAGKAAEKATKAAGGSQEAQDLANAVGFFIPSAMGVVSGLKSGTVETPEGKFSAASAFGGRMRAGVARTPDVISGRVKVGGTQFEVNIPRGGQGVPEPSEAAKALMSYEQHTGNPDFQPAPAPPEPAPDLGPQHLTPEVVQGVSSAILKADPSQRPSLMTEAHGNMTKWMMGRGTFVGPDGKIHSVDSEKQAQKLAGQFINDEVDRIDTEQEKAAKRSREKSHEAPEILEVPDNHPSERFLAVKDEKVINAAATRQELEEKLRTDTSSLTAPVSGTPPAEAGLTTDTAAVKKVTQEANIQPGQQPAVLAKKEPPKETAALEKPPEPVKPADVAEIGKEEPESGRTILQPSDDVMQNERLASEAAPELTTKLSQIASGVDGARFDRIRPQKELGRVDEKVEEAGKPAETVPDYLAAQIAADTPQAKDQLIAELKKQFKVVSVEDSFLHGREKLAGYPSANVQVQMGNGLTAEVQIVPREIQETANQTHKYYSAGREAELRGDHAERDRQFAEAKKLHDAAMDKFRQRNGIEEPKRQTLTRYGQKNEDLSPEKPHGLYMTLDKDGLVSPHEDVGPEKFTADATASNPLQVNSEKVKHARFAEFESGHGSAGVLALKKLSSPEEFNQLLKMDKNELRGVLNREFPGHDYSKYYDSYELLEALGAQRARKAGYDAIILDDKEPNLSNQNFSEYVALKPSAIRFHKDSSQETIPLGGRIEHVKAEKGAGPSPSATPQGQQAVIVKPKVVDQRGDHIYHDMPVETVKDESSLDRRWEILPNGHVRLTWPGWGISKGDLQLSFRRAVFDYFNSGVEEPGIFWRFTNNKLEPSLANRGRLRASIDASSGNRTEAGVSVSSGLEYSNFGYPYGYKVTGDVVGRGADGEPLLNPKTIKVIGDIQKTRDILSTEGRKRSAALSANLKKHGWTKEQYSSNATFVPSSEFYRHPQVETLATQASSESSSLPKSGGTSHFSTANEVKSVPLDELDKISTEDRRSVSRGADRRNNLSQRKALDELTPEEMTPAEKDAEIKALRQEKFTSEKTGLPNYKAFLKDEGQLSHVGYADVDDFKPFNTELGKVAVDTKVLPKIGEAFQRAAAKDPAGSIRVYHRSGDEFLFRTNDPAAVGRVVDRVNKELAEAVFTAESPDGKIHVKKGAGLSHGTGESETAAEHDAEHGEHAGSKQQRKAAGLRSGARDNVGRVGEEPAQGLEAGGREISERINDQEHTQRGDTQNLSEPARSVPLEELDKITSADEAEPFKWGRQGKGYLRTIPSHSGVGRFISESKEVATVGLPGRYHPIDHTVYYNKGKLTVLSSSHGYSNDTYVHEIAPADYGDQFRWKQRKDVAEIAEKFGAKVSAQRTKIVADAGAMPGLLKPAREFKTVIEQPRATAQFDEAVKHTGAEVKEGRPSEAFAEKIKEATYLEPPDDAALKEKFKDAAYQREYFKSALQQAKEAWAGHVDDYEFLSENPNRTNEKNRPSKLDTDQLYIKVPEDGHFLVNNTPYAIEKALKGATRGFSTPRSTFNPKPKPERFIPPKSTPENVEKYRSDLEEALSDAESEQRRLEQNLKDHEESVTRQAELTDDLNKELKALRAKPNGEQEAVIRREYQDKLRRLPHRMTEDEIDHANDRLAELKEEIPIHRQNLRDFNDSFPTAGSQETEPAGTSQEITTPKIVPGGRSPKTGNETGLNDIQQLANSIATATPGANLSTRLRIAANMGEKRATGHDELSKVIGWMKGRWAGLKDAILRPPASGDYQKITGEWSGADQRSALDLYRFAKTINEKVPSKLRQEAISNWIEAGGDEDVLRERVEKSSKEYKPGYEAALDLSDAEKTIARNIMNFHDSTGKEAIDAGLMEHAVENYIQHIYENNPKAFSRIRAEMNFNSLITKPSFTKKRTLPTYFDAEQMGLKPKNKAVGFLTTAHQRSLREALAARAYIRNLMKGKATDGRPLVATSWASAKEIEGEPESSWLIQPNLKPGEEFADYSTINHPALRGWKWAGEVDGKPIFVRGDAVVHPEIYNHLHNNLSKSWLTQNKVGRVVMATNAELKNLVLSLSGFHQTTLGTHALEHRVNPFMPPELNLNDPKQGALVDHGLMVAHYDAMEMFGEGLASGGLITKIPVIGPLEKWYMNKLFRDYMPKLKMKMALDALERNRKRFPELSEDELHFLTANQANAAFGGLNYRMLGRNKTLQDTLRLFMMAPDFTEARGRFVAQAFTKYGREQLAALMLGAAVLYTTCRILNEISDGQAHWDKPFSVVHDKKEYSLRMVQGDLEYLIRDMFDEGIPKQFIINRLSPIAAMILEKDQHYHKKNESLGDKIKSHAQGAAPIPLQPWLQHSHDTNAQKAVETMMKIVGVNEKQEPKRK